MDKALVMGMQLSSGAGSGGGSVVVPNINATATTLPAGSDATVTKSGSNTNVVFAFGIPQGAPGQGVPTGGTTGQVLAKNSDNDYDTSWVDQTGGGGSYTQGNGIAISGQEISVRLSEVQGNVATIASDGGLFVSAGGSLILESIEITTPPTTTTYTAGQVFDNTGMVVTANYNFGLSQEVTGYTISPSGALTGDVTQITVTYSEGGVVKTATQAVTVNRLVPTLTISEPSVDLDEQTPGVALTITYTGDGTLSATSNYPDIVGVSIEDNTTLAITSLATTSQVVQVTVSATQTGIYASASKTVTVYNYFTVQIYGAIWDGGADPAWSRTDGAELFADPQPAVNNGTGESPFDSIMPWAGMVKVEDPVGGTMVAIPKYWYKWTRSGASMQLQISNGAQEGFYVSPAHADRGDGQGERDVVYVGRYHCNSSYVSQTGVKPLGSITRATARTNISALGAEYWQYDFAMYWTIAMLYLVEFANWNSQAMIGYGCSPDGSVFNMGLTDTMQYHTGTSAATRETYGCCQYRNIEELWDNVLDWCDGIYCYGSGIYVINNPMNFSDSSGGVMVGNKMGPGYISNWSNPSSTTFNWALYPGNTGGSATTFVCDNVAQGSGVTVYVGGSYDNTRGNGIFSLNGVYKATYTSVAIGARSMKLPNTTT